MLDELGTMPDEVTASLRAQGIKGVRNTVRILNPVVRYFTTQTPGVRVVDLILVDRLRIVFASGELTEVPVPEAVWSSPSVVWRRNGPFFPECRRFWCVDPIRLHSQPYSSSRQGCCRHSRPGHRSPKPGN